MTSPRPASYSVSPLDVDGLWLVRYTGDVTLQLRKEALVAYDAASVGHRARGILVDLRDARWAMSLADSFSFGQDLTGSDSIRGVRLVFLEQPDHVERSRFMETVAINRGLRARIMTCWDEAVEWLQGDVTHDATRLPDPRTPPGATGN